MGVEDDGPSLKSRWPVVIPNWKRGDRLLSLNISYCSNFTDKGIECIASTCKALTDVNISGCTKLTDESVLLLATCCPCVSHVKMSYCHAMTDVALHHMVRTVVVVVLFSSFLLFLCFHCSHRSLPQTHLQNHTHTNTGGWKNSPDGSCPR